MREGGREGAHHWDARPLEAALLGAVCGQRAEDDVAAPLDADREDADGRDDHVERVDEEREHHEAGRVLRRGHEAGRRGWPGAADKATHGGTRVWWEGRDAWKRLGEAGRGYVQ